MTGYGSSLSTPAALAAAGLWLGLWAGEAAAQTVADDVVCAGCVQASDIANGTIGPNKLIPGSINAATIANNAIRSNKILDGAVRNADIADDAVTAAKIAPGAVTRTKIGLGEVFGGNLDSIVLDLIAPTLTRITSAAFVPTGSNFSTFFNDRDGYLIPSNSTNSFCARAPIDVTPLTFIEQVDAFVFTASAGGTLTVAVKSVSYTGGSPTAAVEHISEDVSGVAVSGIWRVELVANPIFEFEFRTAYWVEVCITGDGLNARNLRFYAAEVFTTPRF